MYRVILPEGQMTCEQFERGDDGVELQDEDGAFLAFVPYSNLHAILDEAVYEEDERSIM
ncbi:hypothetical protein ACFQGT_11650 [Natrialbaceae archaeon GCM10025810]|uniref:hypothetical protein n=1 Tax=Halovalidus salilacus TaxID=3075124 RepID=UPI003613B5B3